MGSRPGHTPRGGVPTFPERRQADLVAPLRLSRRMRQRGRRSRGAASVWRLRRTVPTRGLDPARGWRRDRPADGAAALLRQGTSRPALAQAMPAARDEDCEAAGSRAPWQRLMTDPAGRSAHVLPATARGRFPSSIPGKDRTARAAWPAPGSTAGAAGAAVRFRGLAQPRWGRLAPASRRGLPPSRQAGASRALACPAGWRDYPRWKIKIRMESLA